MGKLVADYLNIKNDDGVVKDLDGNILLDFASKQEENGYVKINGLIIQWGVVDNDKDGSQTFNYPISFPNNVFNVVYQYVGGGDVGSTNISVLASDNFSYDKDGWTNDRDDDIDDTIKLAYIAVGN